MIAFLVTQAVRLVGVRWAKPALIGLAVVLVLAAVFALRSCGGNQAAKQTEQTTRSGEAIANSAAGALGKYGAAVGNETTRAADVVQTNREISNATSRDAQRNAVLDRVCREKGHRNDPACKLR